MLFCSQKSRSFFGGKSQKSRLQTVGFSKASHLVDTFRPPRPCVRFSFVNAASAIWVPWRKTSIFLQDQKKAGFFSIFFSPSKRLGVGFINRSIWNFQSGTRFALTSSPSKHDGSTGDPLLLKWPTKIKGFPSSSLQSEFFWLIFGKSFGSFSPKFLEWFGKSGFVENLRSTSCGFRSSCSRGADQPALASLRSSRSYGEPWKSTIRWSRGRLEQLHYMLFPSVFVGRLRNVYYGPQ